MTTIYPHLSSPHLSFLSKRENRKGQRGRSMKQLMSEEQKASSAWRRGGEASREGEWSKEQKAVWCERAGGKLLTHSSNRGIEGTKWREQDSDSNKSHVTVCLAVGRKPWMYFWQRVLQMQISQWIQGETGQALEEGSVKNHQAEKAWKAHGWETTGSWDTGYEKHIFVLLLLLTTHQLLGTNGEKQLSWMDILFLWPITHLLFINWVSLKQLLLCSWQKS